MRKLAPTVRPLAEGASDNHTPSSTARAAALPSPRSTQPSRLVAYQPISPSIFLNYVAPSLSRIVPKTAKRSGISFPVWDVG
jgi:hypothetical protein